jgi:hypothetical protein
MTAFGTLRAARRNPLCQRAGQHQPIAAAQPHEEKPANHFAALKIRTDGGIVSPNEPKARRRTAGGV